MVEEEPLMDGEDIRDEPRGDTLNMLGLFA
jgi:hypothetical protein